MKNKGLGQLIILPLVCFVTFASAAISGTIARNWNEKKNQQATEYMLAGDYETALLLFDEIKDFRGVDEKIKECNRKLGYEICPECGCVLNKKRLNGKD